MSCLSYARINLVELLYVFLEPPCYIHPLLKICLRLVQGVGVL